MKRTRQLLDDLLQDDIPADFQAALMAKAVRTARRRKRLRRFSTALSVVVLAGIVTLAFRGTHEPVVSLNQGYQPISATAPELSSNSLQVVSTKPDSTLTVVQTSVAGKPADIDDKQLFALTAGRPIALIHRKPGQTELVLFNSEGNKGFIVR